jgi:hypothetical protein
MRIEPDDETEYHSVIGNRQLLLQGPGYGRLETQLEFRMGSQYAAVVRKCLTAGMTSGGGLDEDFEDSIEVQQDTLTTLKRLLSAL